MILAPNPKESEVSSGFALVIALSLISRSKRLRRGIVLALSLIATATTAHSKESILYGGGPLYYEATEHRDLLRASGFTTLVIWTIHVYGDGDLVLNDHKIIDDGVYVGRSSWPSEVAAFKSGPSSIQRIEISVGASIAGSFETIESLIDSEGTGPGSTLYENFQALRAAVPAIDAVNFDDETNYDVASSVAFAIMLNDLGYQISLVPYELPNFWDSVYNQVQVQRPGAIDRIDLQCYAGGTGNDPSVWNTYFGGLSGLRVTPGLWNYPKTGRQPHHVENQFNYWNDQSELAGGFMWLFDDMLPFQEEDDGYIDYPVSSWATAINNALDISIPTAPPNTDPNSLIATNPGFESGSYGWYTVGGDIDSTQASEGSHSARLVSSGTGDPGEWRIGYGNLTQGDVYQLSFDYKTASGATGNPQMAFKFYGGGVLKAEVQRTLNTTGDEWRTVTTDLEVPVDAEFFEVVFSVSSFGAFSGTAWMDNVAVRPLIWVNGLNLLDEGAGVVIHYDVLPGFNYYVEYRENLVTLPDWQALPGTPHNEGQVTDSLGGSPTTRFYRVRRESQ